MKIFGTNLWNRSSIRVFSATLISALFISVLSQPASATGICSFAGGSGTAADPYQVENPSQLHSVDTCNTGSTYKYYAQTADLDLTPNANDTWNSTSPWDGSTGGGWMPIGDMSKKFFGSYDGNGHIITNLQINRTADQQGIFGVTDNSLIQNLIVGSDTLSEAGEVRAESNFGIAVVVGRSEFTSFRNIKVKKTRLKGYGNVGAITGTLQQGGLISNVSSSAIINTIDTGYGDGNRGSSVGGIAGEVNNGQILNATFEGSLTTGLNNSGGLIGFAYNSTISDSKVHADIDVKPIDGIDVDSSTSGIQHNEANTIGGIVGYSYTSGISNSEFEGAITVDSTLPKVYDVGGAAGYFASAAIHHVSAQIHISDQSIEIPDSGNPSVRLGGLVGSMQQSSISSSYATGSVTSNFGERIGGLVGETQSAVSITDTFTRVITSGADKISGLIGYTNSRSTSLVHAYAAGAVVSTGLSDAVAMGDQYLESAGSKTNTFDSTLAGAITTTTLVAGNATSSMKTKATFTSLGFDFDSANPIWVIDPTINDGYPFLVGSVLDTRTTSGSGSGPSGNNGSNSESSAPTSTRLCSTGIGTILFKEGSTSLTSSAKTLLRNYAKKIKESGCALVTLEGYTAKSGSSTKISNANAAKVSKARNAAVRKYLTVQFKRLGISVSVRTQALSSSNPIGNNKSATGKAQNRRVEIFLAG